MTDEAIQLEPCPFCGGPAEIIEAEEAGPQAYVVQCTTLACLASSKVIYALKEDVTDLLAETWNRRSTPLTSSG